MYLLCYIASSNYAKSAASIYRSLGAAELQAGVHGAAESYYKKALGCSKYYEFDHDIDLSRTLQELSRVHAERNDYKLAKPLAATASNVASKYSISYQDQTEKIPLSGQKSESMKPSWKLTSELSSQPTKFYRTV